MTVAYIGVAALTLVRTNTGQAAYVYAGAVAPDGILAEDLERLVAEGYLAEIPAQVLPDRVVVPDDPGDGSAGSGVTVDRPKATAVKSAWLDYRVSTGQLTAEQRAEVHADELDLTVEQLKDDEFMDDWATAPGRS